MNVLNSLARSGGRKVKHFKSWKFYKELIFASFAIVAGFIIGMNAINMVVFAQSNDKTIALTYASNPQVIFPKLRVGENSIKLDEKFSESADWISRTSFQVENTSDHPIVYLAIDVLFPETRASGPVMAYPFTFGRRPNSKLRQKNEPFLLMPGEKLDISLASKYADIARFLEERHGIESINKVELSVDFLIFDDGVGWNAGNFKVQDPNDPDRYNDVGKIRPRVKP